MSIATNSNPNTFASYAKLTGDIDIHYEWAKIALTNHFRETGKTIPTARVSSAQARGAAKKYAYWGVVRYEIRLSKAGELVNVALERASSDRRSVTKAEQDLETLCEQEKRLPVAEIGKLRPSTIIYLHKEIFNLP
jgi:hypothetical protein